jgi:hypothetical protein
MTEVIVFHHLLGRTNGVQDFADGPGQVLHDVCTALASPDQADA